MKTPEISIITATYNRSNILAYSIQSVIDQSYQNWELLVIGDACTDDTEAVVHNFADDRIQFINLEVNFGEQSGPNNVGLKRARGAFIAFLNHDDLWFPDHLQRTLDCLLSTQADLVMAGGVVDHGPDKPMDITGLFSERRGYDPITTFVPASNWLFRRALLQEIGFWRPARELYLAPSHDWQQRVFNARKRIQASGHITVVALPSSSRKNVYADRSFTENKRAHRLMQDPSFRSELLTKVIYQWGQTYYYEEKLHLKRFLFQKIKNFLQNSGINTLEWSFRLRYGKGGIIRKFRKQRGLKNT